MKWRILPALAAILAVVLLVQDGSEAWSASEAPGGIVVVCNDSVKASSLSRGEIKEMFLGRKTRWADGSRVVLAALREGGASELFLREYVGKTPQQFSRHWNRQTFTGKGRGPDLFAEPGDLIEFVKNTPGAIGYVPADVYQGQVKSVSIE
ncbi:MAG TPA: hypothetical protein PKM41_07535 [Deltaproteobacteria bacterium]|nr:hypothetical protein [Deltaproteobacteria bacterium]HOI06935.1 hypothetical protein [Deltaproteobacteria bacterium]